MAVATASNIGSVATITGNPQNMLIGSLSGISYLDFAAHLAPVAVSGLFVNWALLYWICLRGSSDDVPCARRCAVRNSRHGRIRRKPVVVLVVVLVGFLVGVPAAMMAASGAALLLVSRSVDPRKVYDEVDWGLLVFFLGLFIIVSGAERAGLVASLLRPMAAWNLHRLPDVRRRHGPAVERRQQRAGGHAAADARAGLSDPHAGWLALAMASTLAGNLTITGSVANIIVVERAAAEQVPIGFQEYARVGIPITLATLALGGVWLWLIG